MAHKSRIVGFFGGTFDPIHFGHINLAIQLYEKHHLDEVLFCPAWRSPLKKDRKPVASPEQRLAMLQLALEEIPQFHAASHEVDLGRVSYTVDTLHDLLAQSRKAIAFRLILSEESAAHLDQWKDAQTLIELAPPLIGMRSLSSLEGKWADGLRSFCTETKLFDISSTEIRHRLKRNLYCGHLVPHGVLKLIKMNGIYE